MPAPIIKSLEELKKDPNFKSSKEQIIVKRKRRSDDEHFYQNKFLAELAKSVRPIFVKVDTDTQDRHFKSGYDFEMSANKKVLYVETKVSDAKKKGFTGESKLSLYQKMTRNRVVNSRGIYIVFVFNRRYEYWEIAIFDTVSTTPSKVLWKSNQGAVQLFERYLYEGIWR